MLTVEYSYVDSQFYVSKFVTTGTSLDTETVDGAEIYLTTNGSLIPEMNVEV